MYLLHPKWFPLYLQFRKSSVYWPKTDTIIHLPSIALNGISAPTLLSFPLFIPHSNKFLGSLILTGNNHFNCYQFYLFLGLLAKINQCWSNFIYLFLLTVVSSLTCSHLLTILQCLHILTKVYNTIISFILSILLFL